MGLGMGLGCPLPTPSTTPYPGNLAVDDGYPGGRVVYYDFGMMERVEPKARRCGGDVGEMWRRCSGDVAEMWGRCSGDVGEMCGRCRGDVGMMERVEPKVV